MVRKKSPQEAKVSKKKGDSAKIWLQELTAAEKREQAWVKRAQKIVDRYRDERERSGDGERRTNILWSNTEILKSVLFQRVGNPDVRRRFPKKGKDERAARTSALVLERSLSYCSDEYDADAQAECAIEDHLLPGRGVLWVVYDAEVMEAKRDTSEDMAEGETLDAEESETEPVEINDQTVRMAHVFWKDYRTSAGRKESDIWWKGRRHQYSRDELKTYFPDHYDAIPMLAEMEGAPAYKEAGESFKRANVWEIWDKTRKERVYVAEDYPIILKRDEDPYRLKEFFPCPSALYGCKTTSSLVPIPEYTLYQDQCEELDAITTRLNRLIDALKRRGVYDASTDGSESQLAQLAFAGDNEFLPYNGFAALMEKGGLANVFQTENLKPIIEVVQQLYQQRSTLIQTIYEVTGISDVVRGASNPNETATAQRIKGQFGSLRVTNRQTRVNKFIRDAYRIKAEIIAEHFTREKLQEMTGIDMPLQADIDRAKAQLSALDQMRQAQEQQQPQGDGAPPQPMPAMPQPDPELIAELQATAKAVSWEDIEHILRSDTRRGYKVDIETEDTAQVDEDAEKSRRIEFLSAMDPVIDKAIMLAGTNPEMLPIAKETVMFAVKGFKVGRQLEETFEDAFDQLTHRPKQEAPPDPEQQKVELERQKTNADIQIRMEAAKAEIEGKQIEHQLKRADLAIKGAELQGKQAEMAMKSQQMDMEFMQGRMELEQKAVEGERAAESHEMKIEGAKADQQRKTEIAQTKAMNGSENGVALKDPQQQTATVQAPQSQLQQALLALVAGMDELRKSNEMVMRAVTAPRTTRLIRDASGRSVAAVQQVMDFGAQPQLAN